MLMRLLGGSGMLLWVAVDLLGMGWPQDMIQVILLRLVLGAGIHMLHP